MVLSQRKPELLMEKVSDSNGIISALAFDQGCFKEDDCKVPNTRTET